MIEIADNRKWRTHDVVDAAGHKLGVLESVFVATSTDEPAMATVLVRLPAGRHLVFVPPDGAVVGPGCVKVDHDRPLVEKCPAIGTDDVLPAETRRRSSRTTACPISPA